MAQQPTVLVVDDDASIRKMLTEVLSLEGIPVETAADGREALEIIPKSGPLVVLLDLLMQGVNGWQVMEALEANPAERARHRIILMSAWSTLETARELKPDGKLVKPFTVDQLLNAISADG